MDVYHTTRISNHSDEITKLGKRINRKFKKCTYIGDIPINDEEYVLLKQGLKRAYNAICNSSRHEYISPLFAVALVQIGIRFYDGRFWSYVKQELELEKLPQNHQNWIGTSFYKTLLKYNKFHVEESEFMNNILLHCFITKYYANDLFDFLFAYYQIDLDRDLSRNSTEMRNYLMQSMSKGELTARAYKIKKHTADAVSANERGCKIRVAHILRFMDNALFNDSLPTNSRNRIAQLFCEWAKSSKKFDFEKKRTRGLTHSGEKRFGTPYIHFDIKKEWFCLVFPPQYIHLDDNEELPEITWKIRIDENEQILPVNTDNCVTGCKTEKHETNFPSPELLMKEISIELCKNNSERIKRFKIRSDSIRFFDSDWNMIDSAIYTKYLPAGNAFAFCYPNEILLSDSDAVIDCEKKFGYELYTLSLEKGDVLRLPDGKAKSVGKPLEEGILSQNLVPGANIFDAGEKYPIYNTVPSVYFRMTPVQENGTLIVINGAKYRFDIEKCVRFDLDEETEEKGYIVKLSDLITAGGIYNVMIDVPNSRKDRNYLFAFLPAFSYRFENAPYIFQETGIISFSENQMIRSASSSEHITRFCFDISPNQDELPFVYDTGDRTIDIHIFIPVLKWKFDDNEWSVERPGEVWYKEFPKVIYIKYPDDEIAFSMSPTMLGSSNENEEDDTFSIVFAKNKEKQVFECDTRKIISWFGYEEAIRILRLDLSSQSISFANVITHCFLIGKPTVNENIDEHELLINSNIIGFSNCAADIFLNDVLIAEKQPVLSSGVHLHSPFKSGDYKIIYYEWDDNEDDFGFDDYRKFDERTIHFDSRYDLSNREIIIQSVFKKNRDFSIFAPECHELYSPIKVIDLISDEENAYCGKCNINGQLLTVKISMSNQKYSQACISYYDEEDEDYFDFLFDKQTDALVVEEDKALDTKQKSNRYVLLDSEDYVYNIKIK